MFWFYLIIQIILIIVIIAWSIQFFNILFKGHAPFIITRRKVVKAVLDEIKLEKRDIFYELGSGSASILRKLEKKYPRNKLIGIEYALVPWLISKIQKSFSNSNAIIKKKNFFKIDLSQADYIYCFLNIETMEKLEKKFIKECKKGTIIISYIFQLPHIKPYKTILVRKNHIYFYKI
ncbi:MAG: hypothetical protein ABIG10_00155 [bacterium]